MNPYLILAGIVGAMATFGSGFLVGKEFESGQCDGRLLSEMESVNKLIAIKDDAIAQRDGQIDKINVAIDAQKDEIAALRRQEAAARDEAASMARERALAAEQAREALRNVLSQLKDAIDNEDFGVCAGERVPDNFVQLLNDASAAEASLGDGPDSDVPSGTSDR